MLLLDEPTVHLDFRHQVDTMELLVDLNERAGTHGRSPSSTTSALAASFFPRFVVLDAGRIVADGPPAEVLTPERIRESFRVDPVHVHLPDAASVASSCVGSS